MKDRLWELVKTDSFYLRLRWSCYLLNLSVGSCTFLVLFSHYLYLKLLAEPDPLEGKGPWDILQYEKERFNGLCLE